MKTKYHLLMRFTVISAFILALMGIAPVKSFAEEILDTKGKDFWLTFIPNYHKNLTGDSLYIFITCDKATKGKIEYKDRYNTSFQKDFAITNPSEMYTLQLHAREFSLFGYNESGVMSPIIRNNSERIAWQSFHVTADDEVTVYAHSQAVTTSEAFLVLPTDVLNNDYFVISYNSDGTSSGSSIESRSTPSQFAIVATEDNTEVTIKPSAPTKYNNLITQKVDMQKGEVYLVQALIEPGMLITDLTGTEIHSNRPIAVFAGHQRSKIPIRYQFELRSRDVLIEQMPPLVTWGKDAYIIPFEQSLHTSIFGDDLFRILSANDKTEIYIDGTFVTTLSKGEFYEGILDKAMSIKASDPILVAQYKQTSQENGSSYKTHSDPLMMLVPPKEQFMDSYRIINLQAYESDTAVYSAQYIAVVVPNEIKSTILIDGANIAQNLFKDIPGSGYSYATVQVSDGVHEVRAIKEFGIYIYGYGYANSYGYIGGMRLNNLDQTPFVSYMDSCYTIWGQVIDSTEGSSGIEEVVSPVENEENVTVDIDDFELNAKNVGFVATLDNINKDGKFKIAAADTSGNTVEQSFIIPGFTLAMPGNEDVDTIPVIEVFVGEELEYNINVEIENYGSYDKTVKKMWLTNTDVFEIDQAVPVDYKSGKTSVIVVKFDNYKYDDAKDTIWIETRCGVKALAALHIWTNDCDRTAFEYPDFSDPSKLKMKGKARILNDTLLLTPAMANIAGAVWHREYIPVKKGFTTEFNFLVSQGDNGSAVDKSLPGADGIAFVIQNNDIHQVGSAGGGIGYHNIPNSIAIEFDLFANDSTQIDNYYDPNGNHVAVQSNGTEKNTAKHTGGALLGINPDLQLIKPYDLDYFVRIDYNDSTNTLDIYLDRTGDFEEPVLTVNDLELSDLLDLHEGEWAYVGFTSATGQAFERHKIANWSFCPNPTKPLVGVEDNKLSQDQFIDVYPNPATDKVNIEINSPNDGDVEIAIFDMSGRKLETIANKRIYSGNNKFVWNAASYAAGTYICKVYAGGEAFMERIVIVRGK